VRVSLRCCKSEPSIYYRYSKRGTIKRDTSKEAERELEQIHSNTHTRTHAGTRTMNGAAATTADDGVGATTDNPMELLMRHSSPLISIQTTGVRVTSPLAERNSSPSPLHLSRPRSNPRNRTPMRYESPLNADAFLPTNNEGRRITIRPMTAGRAVGTTMAAPRVSSTCTVLYSIAGLFVWTQIRTYNVLWLLSSFVL
jgi:hypothetical protein